MDSIFRKSKEIKDFKVYDVDAEWNAFQSLVNESPNDQLPQVNVISLPEKKKSNKILLYFLSSIAASLLLILTSLFLFNKPENNRASFATADQEKSIQLVDGSIVHLGQHSSIEYPLTLENLTERKVTLKGIGKFEVAKNATLPFKVYYGAVLVEVLGTEFSVAKIDNKVSIENLSGSVKIAQVLNKDNFKVLEPGDVFYYSNGSFSDARDTVVDVVIAPVMAVQKPKVIPAKKKIVEPVVEEPSPIVEESVKGSKYKLDSVIKDHLLKYHKDKIKLAKKVKLDYNQVVRLDISRPYFEILTELQNQGLIKFEKGDCDDCYIIQAPEK